MLAESLAGLLGELYRTRNALWQREAELAAGVPVVQHSQEEQHLVFNEFYRASNARKIERDGTGLGLSIAKQIVERHGGKISVESKQGSGTTFRLTLAKTS